MHICLVYDLLYPYTIGGAERWYRSLAERLAAEGYRVTYLTMRHWPDGEVAEVPGVEVVPVARGAELYTASGRRRIGPPLRFGLGVLRHLSRAGARYDVVHTASFPYFSLLAAARARRRHRFRIVVDWFEVWSSEYWRDYLGPVGGRIGLAVQRRCIRVPQQAFCFSRLFARRLQEHGLRGEVTVLEGIYAGPPGTPPSPPSRSSSSPGVTSPRSRRLHWCRRSRVPARERPTSGGDPRRRPRPTGGTASDRRARPRRRCGGTRVRTRGPIAQHPSTRALSRAALEARGLWPRGRRGGGTWRAERGRARPGQRGDRARRGR